jgi:hypothetical protein
VLVTITDRGRPAEAVPPRICDDILRDPTGTMTSVPVPVQIREIECDGVS